MNTAAGEIALASGLLVLAAQDAIQPFKVKRNPARVQAEARLFCLGQVEPWRRAREAWCGVAGVDPDAFRLAVLRLVAAACTTPIAYGLPGSPRSLRHARRALSLQSRRRERDGFPAQPARACPQPGT